MAITEKQRHDFFKKDEEVFGDDDAGTLMNLLPPVGWADVATKDDLRTFAAEIRAEMQRELRHQTVTFLTANAVILGVFAAVIQATS